VNGESDQFGVRAPRQQRRQWCGGSESAEEGRPEAAVTGVLIHENTDAAAAAQQLNRFAETFAPLKNLEAKSAARFANVSIDMRIADPLVNGRGPLSARKMREIACKTPRNQCGSGIGRTAAFVRKQFSTCSKFSRAHALQNFFHRHAGELHAAKQIRSEPLKMSAHDPAHLFFRKLVAESDAHIAQTPACGSAAGLARQWRRRFARSRISRAAATRSSKSCSGAVKKINSVIEHLRAINRLRFRAGNQYVCLPSVNARRGSHQSRIDGNLGAFWASFGVFGGCLSYTPKWTRNCEQLKRISRGWRKSCCALKDVKRDLQSLREEHQTVTPQHRRARRQDSFRAVSTISAAAKTECVRAG
jgi:hypothetical protein